MATAAMRLANMNLIGIFPPHPAPRRRFSDAHYFLRACHRGTDVYETQDLLGTLLKRCVLLRNLGGIQADPTIGWPAAFNP
jgi:hypothetical protein